LGQVAYHLGELTTARTYLEQSFSLSPSQQKWAGIELRIDAEIDIRTNLAQCLAVLGYPDQARIHIEAALIRAQALAHPWSLALALQYAAHVQAACGAWGTVKDHADALVKLANQRGWSALAAHGLYYHGQALAAQGDPVAGLAQMQQGMRAARSKQESKQEMLQQYLYANLAEAYGQCGQAEDGLTLLEDAFAHSRTGGPRITESRLYRVQGDLWLAHAAEQYQAEAERCFDRALAVARQQQAKSLELRAALSLARLWQCQGKRTDAYQMLAEVYNWFTEGFATANLQEARQLLRQLSGPS
jgi:adenylate cyclase